jgi:hypothetical protein
MHDAVALEAKGVPTAVILTANFLHEAHMQRAALGMDGLHPVVITHPLSTLSDAEIAGRASEAVPQIKQVLLSGAS